MAVKRARAARGINLVFVCSIILRAPVTLLLRGNVFNQTVLFYRALQQVIDIELGLNKIAKSIGFSELIELP